MFSIRMLNTYRRIYLSIHLMCYPGNECLSVIQFSSALEKLPHCALDIVSWIHGSTRPDLLWHGEEVKKSCRGDRPYFWTLFLISVMLEFIWISGHPLLIFFLIVQMSQKHRSFLVIFNYFPPFACVTVLMCKYPG